MLEKDAEVRFIETMRRHADLKKSSDIKVLKAVHTATYPAKPIRFRPAARSAMDETDAEEDDEDSLAAARYRPSATTRCSAAPLLLDK